MSGAKLRLRRWLPFPPASTANLRPDDTIVINLQRIPNPVQIETQIDHQGEIRLCYIGRLEAAGITVSKLAIKTKNAYINE